ncbi:MAG: hypothetical protein EBZ47_09750, partial [Chlamydiae bacterium]|nr:hypothetical protein [Chlamydiota bacterium]
MLGFIRNLLFAQPTRNAQANQDPPFSYKKYILSSLPIIGAIDEKQKKATIDLIECLRTSYKNITHQNKLELSTLLSRYEFLHNSTINSRTRTLIQQLQSYLKSNDLDNANGICLTLEKELSLLNYHWGSHSRVTKDNLTHPILEETQAALSSMLSSPTLLPYLFDPNSNTSYFRLVEEAERIITDQINSQSKWAAIPNPAALVKSALPNIFLTKPSSRAPFKALFEAIKLEGKEYKADLLKHILKSCYFTHPEFKTCIQNNIDGTSVDDWIETNIDDIQSLLGLVLASGSEVAVDKGYQYKQETYPDQSIFIQETCAFLEKEISNRASKQSSNFIVDSFNEVLSQLNVGSIPTSYAQFLSNSLISILDSSFINKWIEKQSDEGKELFEKIKGDLKQGL